MVQSSAAKNPLLNEWELDSVRRTTLFVISFREVHMRLADVFGPLASEVLALLLRCLMEDESRGDPWKHLERVFRGQGFPHDQCIDLSIVGFGLVLNHLDAAFPGWSSYLQYSGFEHSMRGHRDLVMVVHPDLPRQRHVRN